MQGDDNPRYETELWIRKNVTGFARVPVDSIDWVCSEDDYVRVHTREASYLMRSSIRSLEGRLDPSIIHPNPPPRTGPEKRDPRIPEPKIRRDRSGPAEAASACPPGRVYAKTLRRMVSDLTSSSNA